MPITASIVPLGESPGTAPPVIVAVAAASTTRKRRAYQVLGRDTLPNADDGCERWFVIAESVDAPSRSAAIKQATEGRPGTYATVLVGEWVVEVVEDKQGALATLIADDLIELFGTDVLTSAGITEAQLRAAIAASAAEVTG